MERVMGVEPTTSTLARLHSTSELHPHLENVESTIKIEHMSIYL